MGAEKGGKQATKGQKQIDLENAESIKFYTFIAFAAIAVSFVPFLFNTASGLLLPIFGCVGVFDIFKR